MLRGLRPSLLSASTAAGINSAPRGRKLRRCTPFDGIVALLRLPEPQLPLSDTCSTPAVCTCACRPRTGRSGPRVDAQTARTIDSTSAPPTLARRDVHHSRPVGIPDQPDSSSTSLRNRIRRLTEIRTGIPIRICRLGSLLLRIFRSVLVVGIAWGIEKMTEEFYRRVSAL